MTSALRIGLVGTGFRSAAFARVALAVPDRFEVVGAVSRHPGDRPFDAPVVSTLGELGPVDVVVVAVPPSIAVRAIREAVAAGHAVLTETPAAPTLDELAELWRLVQDGARIQVAEQYHLEPLISAQLAVATRGLLGPVHEAHVSIAHDYHGISVLRRALGLRHEPVTVTGVRREFPVQLGPGRDGDPVEDRVVGSVHTIGWIDAGDRLGVMEFDDQQYRSFIRTSTLTIRGERGELRDAMVRRLHDFRTPVHSPLVRVDAGGPSQHDGLFLRGYQLDGAWIMENDTRPARLADDEISIARLLDGMRAYVDGGPPVYGVDEAAQDQYLQLLVRRAAELGAPVRSEPQPWSRAT
ncbi:Gfo/Idh/MocA family oxidoreductase [Pseudolysinimonas sp.]|uniref:Gfo/Idh/MocA family oxidoreductase n=1 Tax=Pseudolysinimonas sp. TaxID=2680009 RepID=UPI003F7EE80F